MKKIFFVCALAATSLGFVSCSSDDDSNDNPLVNNSLLVGEWKAVELSYTMPGSETPHTFPFSMISGGCDVDELDLNTNFSAELEVENKTNDVCVEQKHYGTWNEEVITLDGVNPKYVVSSTASELFLKYEMTYGNYGTIEVTVKYVKS